MHGRDLAD